LGNALKAFVALVAGVGHLWHRFGPPFFVLFWRLPLIARPPLAHFGIHGFLFIAIALRKQRLLHKVRIGGRILAPGFQNAQILSQSEITVFAFLLEVEGHPQPVNTVVADHRR